MSTSQTRDQLLELSHFLGDERRQMAILAKATRRQRLMMKRFLSKRVAVASKHLAQMTLSHVVSHRW